MSGHASPAGPGRTVHQPIVGDNNLAGNVFLNPSSPRLSDSAFVSNLTRPVDPTIWVKDSWWWVPPRSVEIIDWVSQVSTPPSSTVRMEGITSGHQIGVVEYRWYTVTTNPTFPVLYDQVLTLLQARVGDSGAPMFDFVQAHLLQYNLNISH
ncbi:MAG: hypothetical protein DDT42_01743 [candidate division WS2 bacterium]|uniref:Uncharacterized protein n=1 Tax=Psychracetigena formicireducens TaxID=2986056 RepID=A0A9E2BJ50_PSYF1|nr:hypothetical protein [Candidatus Psychracetigena formicireducens]